MNPRTKIKRTDWEKYILPVIENPDVASVIFYRIEHLPNDVLIHVRTFIAGFEITTTVVWSDVRDKYKDDSVSLNDTGEMPSTLPDTLFERFNHDFMNARGIPEAD